MCPLNGECTKTQEKYPYAWVDTCILGGARLTPVQSTHLDISMKITQQITHQNKRFAAEDGK